MRLRIASRPIAPPDAKAASAGPRMLAALRYPNYRRLWLGSLATSTGHWMQQVAIGWLALTLTNSAAWVGAVGFARGIPMLLFSLIGMAGSGIYRDRTGACANGGHQRRVGG